VADGICIRAAKHGLVLRFGGEIGSSTDENLAWCAQGHAAGLAFDVLFSPEVVNGLLSRLLPGTFLEAGEALRNAALVTHIAAPFVEAIEQAGLQPLTLHHVDVDAAKGSATTGCAIEDENGQVLGRFGARLTADLARLVSARLEALPENTVQTQSAAAIVSLIAGITHLSRSDVLALAPGDGILADHMPLAQGRLLLAAGGAPFRVATLDGLTATLTSEKAMLPPPPLFSPGLPAGDNVPNTSPSSLRTPNIAVPAFQPASAPEPLLSSNEVPLQIMFEVARYEMTVAELGTLHAGSEFQLAQDPKSLVTVRANGVAIAHGEIFQAGDKLAVRITAVKP
jgi:type III secretion system YscQ/HrcQ family protein